MQIDVARRLPSGATDEVGFPRGPLEAIRGLPMLVGDANVFLAKRAFGLYTVAAQRRILTGLSPLFQLRHDGEVYTRTGVYTDVARDTTGRIQRQ